MVFGRFHKVRVFCQRKACSFVVESSSSWLKTAAGFDKSIMESEGYEYLFSGDDIDILGLCAMGSNKEARKIILWNRPKEED